MTRFLAIDPGTYKTGAALFNGPDLVGWWLIQAEKRLPIDERIGSIIQQLEALIAEHGQEVREVVCERTTGIEDRRPAPELQVLVRRIKAWDTRVSHQFTRSIAAINPKALWSDHALTDEPSGIHPPEPGPCGETDAACISSEKGWLMWLGWEYTVESFRREAGLQGVSERIHAIPKDLVLGVDWVYLAKQRLIPGSSQMWLPGEVEERTRYGPGVFEVSRPTRVEKVVSDLSGEDTLDELHAQGITPVVVPHDDPDHAARKRSPQTVAAS